MITQHQANLQLAILQVLDANRTRFGLGVEAVRLHIAPFGFTHTPAAEIETELEYLQEKELVRVPPAEVNPNLRTWQRTAKGREFLAERGL